MKLTSKDLKDFLCKLANVMEKEKEYLCELDRQVGDGDHGVTMSIGCQAIKKEVEIGLTDEKYFDEIFSKTGMTFLNAVGSSVGPLYASGFIQGSKVTKDKVVLNDEDLVRFWIAFGNGIKDRSGAKLGDKTILDTILPMIKALKKEFDNSGVFLDSFKKAVFEAGVGMKSTKNMISKVGRSSRLGDRSIGVQDPGATSAYIILKTFLEFIENLE